VAATVAVAVTRTHVVEPLHPLEELEVVLVLALDQPVNVNVLVNLALHKADLQDFPVPGVIASGSGRVAVTPVDRSDQGGSNGGSHNVAVAVLAELQWFENVAEKN
jgi:hypothetical protein